jgi:hypothetical protein
MEVRGYAMQWSNIEECHLNLRLKHRKMSLNSLKMHIYRLCLDFY